jgi:hypothetical protein
MSEGRFIGTELGENPRRDGHQAVDFGSDSGCGHDQPFDFCVIGAWELGIHFFALPKLHGHVYYPICITLAKEKMSDRPLKTQADRIAQSSPVGRELIAFLRRPDILAKLREAAERGTQPVSAVSKDLLANFTSVIRDPAVKRRVGFFVAAVLDGEGFNVVQANVRMKDPLFKSGAVYKKRPEPTTTPGSLLSRLADAVTEDEARQFVEFLIDRFPGLKKRFW